MGTFWERTGREQGWARGEPRIRALYGLGIEPVSEAIGKPSGDRGRRVPERRRVHTWIEALAGPRRPPQVHPVLAVAPPAAGVLADADPQVAMYFIDITKISDNEDHADYSFSASEAESAGILRLDKTTREIRELRAIAGGQIGGSHLVERGDPARHVERAARKVAAARDRGELPDSMSWTS